MRIVSPLPSATEILCALGARDRLVARSHECDFPPCVEELPAPRLVESLEILAGCIHPEEFGDFLEKHRRSLAPLQMAT